MALGAMVDKPGLKINIVASGLKYFNPSKFRSRVILEFAIPYEVPQELATLYKTDKRKACGMLLEEIKLRMEEVTMQAPSYHELSALMLCRKLYTPIDEVIPYEEMNQLQKHFTLGYAHIKDTPEAKELLQEVTAYKHHLKELGIHDSQVGKFKMNPIQLMKQVVTSFFQLILSALLAIPGMMLLAPLVMLLRYLAEKERKKALKASSVKIVAVDVMASKKVISAIMLYPMFIFCGNLFLSCFMLTYTNFDRWTRLKSHVIYSIMFPIYSYYCIRATDDIFNHFYQFIGRLANLLNFDDFLMLTQQRKLLVEKLHDTIEKYGSESIPNFESQRVFKDGVLVHKVKKSPPKKTSTQDVHILNYLNDIDIESAFEVMSEIGC